MKVSVKEIREMVRNVVATQLKESAEDKKLNSFLDKCSKTLEEQREKLSKLVEEGEKLVLEEPESKESKQLVLHCVGVLKKCHSLCNGACEALKKLY